MLTENYSGSCYNKNSFLTLEVINVDVFGGLQYAACVVWRLQYKYYAKQFVKLTNILGAKEIFLIYIFICLLDIGRIRSGRTNIVNKCENLENIKKSLVLM